MLNQTPPNRKKCNEFWDLIYIFYSELLMRIYTFHNELRKCVHDIVVVKKSRHEKYLFLICFFKSRHEEHFCGSCFFKSGHDDSTPCKGLVCKG